MNVLIFNCGSSSQGFKVYQVGQDGQPTVIAFGKARNVATQTQAQPVIDWRAGCEKGSKGADLRFDHLAEIRRDFSKVVFYILKSTHQRYLSN